MKSADQHGMALGPEEQTQLGLYRDDRCGKVPGCHLRVMASSQTSPNAYGMVYRNWEARDAKIIWLNETQFRIIDDAGGDTIIDLVAQGIIH